MRRNWSCVWTIPGQCTIIQLQSFTDNCRPMPMRWTHITINVSDLDRSVEFYTSFCGLTIVRDRRLEGRHNVCPRPLTAIAEDPTFVFVTVQAGITARPHTYGFRSDTREQGDSMPAAT